MSTTDAMQAAGLVLPPHLTRIEGETNSDEKENSAEEGEKKGRGDGEQTDAAVENDAAMEEEAPEVETPDHDVSTVESIGVEEADENVAPDAAGRVNEAEATADDSEKADEKEAHAAEAAGPSAPADIPARRPISNSVADVRTYPGLPPHGLSEDEVAELFDAVQRMKSKSSNQNFVKHGWQCIYALRTSGSATRGDMCVIDPRDGQKIFSLVGMRRKLGLEEAMARSMV